MSRCHLYGHGGLALGDTEGYRVLKVLVRVFLGSPLTVFSSGAFTGS